MPAKRPVNKESAPHHILFGYWAPVAAVVAVVAVIAHREIAARGYDKGGLGRGEASGKKFPRRHLDPFRSVSITPVWGLRRHDTADAETLRQFTVDIEIRWIDSQFVPRSACQAFDIIRRAGFGILVNAKDVIGAKNENIAATWMDKVVAELVDKNLISGIDCAARNGLPGAVAI